MEQRLVKIAKELNVGTRAIVDYLETKGFYVINKPTTLISDELYGLLIKEFEKSKVEKGRADNIKWGEARPKKKKGPTPSVTIQNKIEIRSKFPQLFKKKKDGSSFSVDQEEKDEKLNLISNLLQGIKNAKRSVEWEEIQFFNGRITILFESKKFNFFDNRAKKSYNLIIPFFVKQKISPPTLFISTEQPKLLLVDNFFNLLEIGSLIYDLQIKEYKAPISAIKKINNLSNKLTLPNAEILSLFSQRQHECIKFLAEKQNDSFKIIPVLELVFQNNKVLRYDESFIFTIKRRQCYFLIWESVEIKKATHIFCSTEVTINEGRKKLQSYIIDAIDHKRERLHNQNAPETKTLNHVKALNHTNFKDWKKRLLNTLNEDFHTIK